jgi:hypothetical protein
MGKAVLEVTEAAPGLEYSIHGAARRLHAATATSCWRKPDVMCIAARAAECPRRHREEIEAVFPGLGYEGLLVVPTCQARAAGARSALHARKRAAALVPPRMPTRLHAPSLRWDERVTWHCCVCSTRRWTW